MKLRDGFTLVELVVVVMIIGVLVAIAAPKMVNIMDDATDNAVRQSLSVVRDAIETYASQHNGNYPSDVDEGQFKADLANYLRGPFPKSPVGTKTNDVAMSGADPLLPDDTTGWMYNGTTGEFIINCSDLSKDGVTTYGEF